MKGARQGPFLFAGVSGSALLRLLQDTRNGAGDGLWLLQLDLVSGAFEEGSDKSMDQDYQLEIYWPRGPGRVVHAYAMWRQADWGSGFTSDDEGVQRILLNNLIAWDDDTEKLCEEGRP